MINKSSHALTPHIHLYNVNNNEKMLEASREKI